MQLNKWILGKIYVQKQTNNTMVIHGNALGKQQIIHNRENNYQSTYNLIMQVKETKVLKSSIKCIQTPTNFTEPLL